MHSLMMIINDTISDIFYEGYMIAGLTSRQFVCFLDKTIKPLEQMHEFDMFYVARLPKVVTRVSEGEIVETHTSLSGKEIEHRRPNVPGK